MAVIEIVMPKIGLNMEEGTIVDWIKKEGDEVKRGDVLFILETEKITAESESPYDGKLVKILIQEGKRDRHILRCYSNDRSIKIV